MAGLAEKKSGYLPALDGWRSVAIFGVLLTHDLPWSIAGHSNAMWKGFGGWGVQLFFAISGILICWRLLEDEEKKGRVELGSFYVRRLFRIQPAAFCYLAAIAMLFWAGVIKANWEYWFSAGFSYINFLVTESTPPGAAALIGHFWTLAVEEHFYILLSLLFLIPRRYRIWSLTLLLVALTEGQAYVTDHGGFSPQISPRRTTWIVQLLLTPALLAMLVRVPHVRVLAERYLRPWVALSLTLAFMVLHQLQWSSQAFADWRHDGWLNVILIVNREMVFFGFALLVVATMLHPKSWSTRVLELAPLRFVGRLSYSIYLWHVLFFIPVYLGDLIHSPVLTVLSARPWKYVATAIAALASYFLCEKPMIQLGHRLAPPVTPGHRDLRETSIEAQAGTVIPC